MSYPEIIDRRQCLIKAGPRTSYLGIECTVAMSPTRQIKVALDNILLGLSDENEADIFIEQAIKLDGTGNGYGRIAA